MPDQKLAAPYGDIVFVNTPNLDRMGAMIYNEEKQRKAAQAKADADLDNEFSKNIAGIHNADIPDLTKAWGDFKAARQSLIATKGGTTPEQQMAALQAKARVYDLISKSKLRKESDKFDVEDYKKNSIRYKKDAHERMLKNMNTPTSQLPKDYHNDYLYDGSQSDFSKALDFAKGDTIDMPTEEVPNGLGKSLYSVKRLSNPSEYFHNVLTKVVGDQQTDDFSKKYFVEPDEYNKVKDQYDLLIADPKVKSRLGMQVDLPQESDLTPLTRAAKYLAMQHTIQNPPVVSLNKVVKDDKAIIDYKFANDMKKLGANDRYIRGRMKYKKELGLPDEVDETTGVAFDEVGSDNDVDISENKGTGLLGINIPTKIGRISKGIVFDVDGNVMKDGQITLDKSSIPANMIVVLDNQKATLQPKVKAVIKNGQIESVETSKGVVDRQAMLNFQKVYNKEPLKGSQLEFGKKSGNNKPFQNKKTFNVINPQTGEVIMSGVDEAAANKAKSKGYKIN